jgi:hypothetical protein
MTALPASISQVALSIGATIVILSVGDLRFA